MGESRGDKVITVCPIIEPRDLLSVNRRKTKTVYSSFIWGKSYVENFVRKKLSIQTFYISNRYFEKIIFPVKKDLRQVC